MADNLSGRVSAVFKCDVQLFDQQSLADILLCVVDRSEELIFRGAILDRLYLAFPFWAANLLQALLFGIYHMNLVQGIYAFVLGAVLGLVRVSVGTIFASIGTHIIFNATSYVLQLVFPSGQKISIVIFAGVYLLATLLFADGLWYTKNKYEQNKKNE